MWDPIRPAIIAPEVRSDASWRGGFEAGFLDRDKLSYAFTLVRSLGVFVNVDQVKERRAAERQGSAGAEVEGQDRHLRSARDRLDLLAADVARLKLGDGIMKQLLIDQEPVLSRDRNQLSEFMVRGRYPIGIGLNVLAIQDFQSHGVGRSVKTLLLPEFDYQSSGSVVWLLNRAPAPQRRQGLHQLAAHEAGPGGVGQGAADQQPVRRCRAGQPGRRRAARRDADADRLGGDAAGGREDPGPGQAADR